MRYHIVSIVAVFLALGIGIVMGTTVIDKGVAAGLRAQFDRANNRANALEEDKVVLQRQLELWDSFGERALPSLVEDRLAGRNVVLVVEDGADAKLLDDIDAALTAAGAALDGRVRLSDKWSLAQAPAAEQLGVALGIASNDHAQLLSRAAVAVARRLQTSANPRATEDLFARLAGAGFITVERAGGSFPRAQPDVVFVPAGNGRPRAPEAEFVLPLLAAVGERRPVVVADHTDAKTFLSDGVRREREVAAVVGTVDHVDTMLGQLSLVQAIAGRAGGGTVSHYGIRRGAGGIAPPLTVLSPTPAPL